MEKIIKAFKEYFNNEFELPSVFKDKGSIDDMKSGWLIRYVFLKDQNGQECLDFIAYHRMTNCRHLRLSIDGEITFLKTYHEGYSFNPELPGDQEVREQEYFEYNREVSRILIRKGLMDIKGNEELFE